LQQRPGQYQISQPLVNPTSFGFLSSGQLYYSEQAR